MIFFDFNCDYLYTDYDTCDECYNYEKCKKIYEEKYGSIENSKKEVLFE